MSGFACRECRATFARWIGQCPTCKAWDSIRAAPTAPMKPAPVALDDVADAPAEPVPVTKIIRSAHPRRATGLEPFDRVIGGGLRAGAYVLLSGGPGSGKSTALAQIAAGLVRSGADDDRVLYVTGEELVDDVADRTDRLGAGDDRVLLVSETDIDRIVALATRVRPILLIVDSLQALRSASGASGMNLLNECCQRLRALAKGEPPIATVAVCHVNKAGIAAGPKALEHWVDITMSLSCGARGTPLAHVRFLRTDKNRHGNASLAGVLEMTERGLVPSDVDPNAEELAADRDAAFEPIAQELLDRYLALGGVVDEALRMRIAGELDFDRYQVTRWPKAPATSLERFASGELRPHGAGVDEPAPVEPVDPVDPYDAEDLLDAPATPPKDPDDETPL